MQLGGRKFVYVRKYDDRLTIQIRQFFIPQAMMETPAEKITFQDLRPSTRGVALTPEQWSELKVLVERIDKDLKSAAAAPAPPPAASPAPPPAAAPAQN